MPAAGCWLCWRLCVLLGQTAPARRCRPRARTARERAGLRRPRSRRRSRVLSRRRHRPAQARRPVRPAARARRRPGRALLFHLRHRGLLPGASRDQAGAAHAGLRHRADRRATARPSKWRATPSDIERIHESGKIAAVLDIEGSFDLDGDPAVISPDVPPGDALGAAFGAQLDQQLCGFLLLAAQMARAERSRPGVRFAR